MTAARSGADDSSPARSGGTSSDAALAAMHTPEAIRARIAGRPRADHVGDFVLGAVDGTITTFAIVAGSAGAGLPEGAALVLGLANAVADGFSMAVSNYLKASAGTGNGRPSTRGRSPARGTTASDRPTTTPSSPPARSERAKSGPGPGCAPRPGRNDRSGVRPAIRVPERSAPPTTRGSRTT